MIELAQNGESPELSDAFEKLGQEAARLQTVIDTVPSFLWTSLPDGSKEYLNKRWYEYTGLSLEQGKGWGWKVVVHPDDLDRLVREWLALVEARKPGELETRIRRYDGEYRWFLIRIVPQLDSEENVVRWFGSNTDIEDRKRAEKKLLEEERELRRITDAIPQTIVVLDPNGHPLYANQAMLDYTGLSMQDVVASDFRARIFHPEDLDRVREERKTGLARGLPFEIEQRVLRKDGLYRWLLLRYNPFQDEQGRLVRWYTTGTDIDDRKRAEDRTRNENVALREDIVRSSMFEEIVGSSEPLRQVMVQVSKVAPTDSTVLVLSETGTIAATNREMTSAVAEGKFRQDLFYRLNVFPIRLPALRERISDISLLAGYLIDRYTQKAGKKTRNIDTKTMELFHAYDWPGNICELQNVVERAVILSEGETFFVEEAWLARATPKSPAASVLTTDLAEREKMMIENARRMQAEHLEELEKQIS
jgi:PAS domain S-box-containing protein